MNDVITARRESLVWELLRKDFRPNQFCPAEVKRGDCRLFLTACASGKDPQTLKSYRLSSTACAR